MLDERLQELSLTGTLRIPPSGAERGFGFVVPDEGQAVPPERHLFLMSGSLFDGDGNWRGRRGWGGLDGRRVVCEAVRQGDRSLVAGIVRFVEGAGPTLAEVLDDIKARLDALEEKIA